MKKLIFSVIGLVAIVTGAIFYFSDRSNMVPIEKPI